MVRRIVCCKSCRKRFTTTSGSTLCLPCRPKEVPPELTYGGSSLSLPPNSKRSDAKICAPVDSGIETKNNNNLTADERSDQMQNTHDGKSSPQSNQSGGNTPPSNAHLSDINEKKRKQSTTSPSEESHGSEIICSSMNRLQSSPINVNGEETGSAIHSCYDYDGQVETLKTPATAAVEQRPSSKKQKIESEKGSCNEFASMAFGIAENNVTGRSEVSMIDVSKDCSNMPIHIALEDVKKSSLEVSMIDVSKDCSNMPIHTRRPKVSIGSTNNGGCNSESDDEIDIMIAQESIWITPGKREGATNEINYIDTETMPLDNEKEDDDSDIVCLGTSSESQLLKDGTLHSKAGDWGVDEHCDSDLYGIDDVANPEIGSLGTFHESQHKSLCQVIDVDKELPYSRGIAPINSKDGTGNEDGNCASDDLNINDHESDFGDLGTSPQPEQHHSPKKDVCYICGSDLARLSTGLRGRVAHMKRCSAKYGKVLGGRRAMNNDGEFDADFVATGADGVSSGPSPKKVAGAFNPYKDQWHGDASSELEMNKAMSPISNTPSKDAQSKQTMLKHFFKAPVKSMTNVLMAGARQVAKGKAIVASKGSTATSGKQSYKKGHWNSRRSGNCPAYKRITGTDFICDGFHYARKSLSENYFLTHFHADHYGGIGKTWSEGAIYCSLSTANLVHQQLGVDKRYLHPLPMNTPTVIASKDKPVTVTLLNANHCPGAIMFLFEVGNKKILHVGDFRWHRELMMQMPQLRAFSNSSPRLDEIFFDTTYCDTKYALPTQEEAIGAAIEVAVKEMAISKKDIKMKTLFLFGSYTIGKEKIYLSVAEKLKMKVYVDSRRYRILSSLEWPKERMQLFTKNKSESCLWVVPLGSVNFKQMRDYMDEGNKNKAFTAPYGRVVGFRPTGWTFRPTAQDKNQRTLPSSRPKPGINLISSKTSGRYSVHGVPYSEHSSFPELVDCLRCLKPKKIIPTVSVSKSEEQVALLLNAL
eukprot:CAMPEP_0202032200 /NCGR_PEP_ID=MMETSP0905-20130828/65400_1 /ASSEMBLY_ACC=CAM_ASM_000554 /TAXON_ID=420261 /ORGANISM="Thalassiosira antarctica, Strain CCMP982" /LENGTH=983 /DNA_ID=CAMNT_0048596055 /DNA_START=87 /DNA_END=3037 /DNA_ORIENTATION=+